MSKRERFISGIYNYCDRWCQRCEHTKRCRVYRDEQRVMRRHKSKGEDPHDMEVVFKDVSRSFEKVMRMITRDAKARGIDLDEIIRESKNVDLETDRDRVEAHPLCREAKRFMDQCGELLERLKPIFNDARSDAINRAEFMDVEDEADALTDVREAFEVLNWDYHLIYVKIKRALGGLFESEDEDDDDFRDSSRSDAAGSASVARRCLMRDKAALLAIYEWDEQIQDTAIDLLAIAERISRAIENLIPECVTFVWPPEE